VVLQHARLYQKLMGGTGAADTSELAQPTGSRG
jgi:hypothetical protein